MTLHSQRKETVDSNDFTIEDYREEPVFLLLEEIEFVYLLPLTKK